MVEFEHLLCAVLVFKNKPVGGAWSPGAEERGLPGKGKTQVGLLFALNTSVWSKEQMFTVVDDLPTPLWGCQAAFQRVLSTPALPPPLPASSSPPCDLARAGQSQSVRPNTRPGALC